MANGLPGIWIVDVDGKTVFVDDQMARLLGEPSRWEIIGHPSSRYIFPEDLDAVHRMFERKKRGDRSAHQCRLRRKDGSAVLVEIQGSALHNEQGQFNVVVSMFTPIPVEPAE